MTMVSLAFGSLSAIVRQNIVLDGAMRHGDHIVGNLHLKTRSENARTSASLEVSGVTPEL